MKKILSLILAFALVLTPAYGHVGYELPHACIEAPGYTFDPTQTANHALKDATDKTKWLDRSVGSLTQILGFAHNGSGISTDTSFSSPGQHHANRALKKIQIWGWKDTNGNGMADLGDSKVGTRTTKWILLSELAPQQSAGDGTGGRAVGWNVAFGASPEYHEIADVLQVGSYGTHSKNIDLRYGESWLLLVRVVDTADLTNLMVITATGADNPYDVGGPAHIDAAVEKWDNGDTSDMIGSDVANDKYIDCHGNTPGTSDGRLQDDDIVWVYRPR